MLSLPSILSGPYHSHKANQINVFWFVWHFDMCNMCLVDWKQVLWDCWSDDMCKKSSFLYRRPGVVGRPHRNQLILHVMIVMMTVTKKNPAAAAADDVCYHFCRKITQFKKVLGALEARNMWKVCPGVYECCVCHVDTREGHNCKTSV